MKRDLLIIMPLLFAQSSLASPLKGTPPNDCEKNAVLAASALANLRMPGAKLEGGGAEKLPSRKNQKQVVYRIDILDSDPVRTQVWPGHNLFRVKLDSELCSPTSIEFIESFMGQ